MWESIKTRKNLLRILLICIGGLFLVLSYLFFINVIKIDAFTECGSQCEYWWSWIINIPPQPICILVCVPRNALYKPFFVVGTLLIIIDICLEFFLILRKVSSKRE